MGDLFLTEDMQALLKNKSICIIGDSVQRTIYKDFITLLQENRFSTVMGLKAKGEETYRNDTLVEGGVKTGLHNGVDYREHRLYETPDHSIRFFFVTRVWDQYWKHAVLPTLRIHPQPEIVIVNSCLWDLTRYGIHGGVAAYRDNLKRLLTEMKSCMQPETLFIWNTTLPLSSDPDKIHGGFLVAEVSVQDKMNLRLDILEANKFASETVSSFNYDVLDFHYWFRGHQDHRVKDGIHWDNEATRLMTNMLLTRIADAWGVGRPGRLFQLALIGSGKDPLLTKELAEADQAREKDKEDEKNNNYRNDNKNYHNVDKQLRGNNVHDGSETGYNAIATNGVAGGMVFPRNPTQSSAKQSMTASHAPFSERLSTGGSFIGNFGSVVGSLNNGVGSASDSRLAALQPLVDINSTAPAPLIGSPSLGESTDTCDEDEYGAAIIKDKVDGTICVVPRGEGRGSKRPYSDIDSDSECSLPPPEEQSAKRAKTGVVYL